MESFNKQKWEDLNLSRDEVKNLGEALQKEEFRSLLLEYVKEINDPENRKQYEKEITQLENERGVEIKFIHPSSGYVIKTSVNGVTKAFINICSNANVGEPFSKPGINGGQRGLQWSIPYCLVPPREDVDKKKNICTVFDVVFHPDTLHMTKSNEAFQKLVNDTALGAVEENFHVSLDKINLKFPKMQFKGMKHATVIRKKIHNFQPSEVTDIPNYPYPPLKCDNVQVSKTYKDLQMQTNKDSSYATPNFIIKYRNNIDMQDYSNDPMTKMAITIPNELVVVIELPLLKRASDATVDVSENLITLLSETPAKYKLNLKLPYPINSSKGCAQFDINKKTLIITLPVMKLKYQSSFDACREDSGVESDNYGRNSSISSDDETEINSCISKPVINSEDTQLDMGVEVCDSKDDNPLQANTHYLLPNFTCRYLENTLMFILHAPKVNPESVNNFIVKGTFRVHVTFQSVGAGYFPINYAVCIMLPQIKVENESMKIEVWDNNVIVSFKLDKIICLRECYVGLDENTLEKFIVPAEVLLNCEELTEKLTLEEKFIVNENGKNGCEKKNNLILRKSKEEEQYGSNTGSLNQPDNFNTAQSLFKECEETQDHLEGNNIQNEEDTDEFLDEGKDISESASSFDESSSSPRHQAIKTRTLSESYQGDSKRKTRGILKIGRSLSESSVDDYASWLPDKLEKTKKTVRFSEVISKQTFRMNSSILGQRKKNQRKMKNKKRAQERRLSESGNDSEGEIDVSFIKGKNLNNKNEIDLWLKEHDSSSCDISDVSEISDISESDDGQKEDVRTDLPCSSKRNHKRRGKKSARKNAATAKLKFMDN